MPHPPSTMTGCVALFFLGCTAVSSGEPACAADTSGSCESESHSLLQRETARGVGARLSADARAADRVRSIPTLVHELYTYGAPASRKTPWRNAASENGCFLGLRSYTENLLGYHDSIHQIDAAAIFNLFPHAWTNTVVLHWNKDSYYVPCDGVTQFGHPDWPMNGAQIYAEWSLHYQREYKPRLQEVTVDGKNVSQDEPFTSAQRFVDFAWRSYNTAKYTNRWIHENMPLWKLVASEVFDRAEDHDPVKIAQHSETLECALIFTGTNSFSEIFTSLEGYETGYCGFTGVHAGYRNELWTLTNYIWEPIRTKLSKCSRVMCIGHSLGGSLCEIFAACANSGNYTDPDYKLLAWKQETPEAMDEVEDDDYSFEAW